MHSHVYSYFISLENLLRAWQLFRLGKTRREDVITYDRYLEDNLFALHRQLKSGHYQHGQYSYFVIHDPKKRNIYKANINDRIIHQAVYQILNPIFEPKFIFDSYSSRAGKGTHRAVKRLADYLDIAEHAIKQNIWLAKCDIRKYFDSINHHILLKIISQQIYDKQYLELIGKILSSYQTNFEQGIPLGNITSQLFANIYLNQLDKYVKKTLGIQYYIRYSDDFVLVSHTQEQLTKWVKLIKKFLKDKLLLDMPDYKIILRKRSWGVDFLGYVILPTGILIRKKTRKRALRKINLQQAAYLQGKISYNQLHQTINSYLGVLKHCQSFKLRQQILLDFNLCQSELI